MTGHSRGTRSPRALRGDFFTRTSLQHLGSHFPPCISILPEAPLTGGHGDLCGNLKISSDKEDKRIWSF